MRRPINKTSNSAQHPKKGEDIVCSAVSVLSHTLIASIVNVIRVIPQVDSRDGYQKIEIDVSQIKDNNCDTFKSFLNFFCIGIFEIERNYTGTIDITFE